MKLTPQQEAAITRCEQAQATNYTAHTERMQDISTAIQATDTERKGN